MPMEMALEVSVRPIGQARSAPKKQTLPKTGADLARYSLLRRETPAVK